MQHHSNANETHLVVDGPAETRRIDAANHAILEQRLVAGSSSDSATVVRVDGRVARFGQILRGKLLSQHISNRKKIFTIRETTMKKLTETCCIKSVL